MLFTGTDKAKKFYLYASLFLITGWLWILLPLTGNSDVSVCFFKNITSYPCPACGSTSSLVRLAEGDWKGAMMINPLGYLTAAGLLVLPLWLLRDAAAKKNTLYRALLAFDHKVREQPLLLLLIALPIILNWIWNIIKM